MANRHGQGAVVRSLPVVAVVLFAVVGLLVSRLDRTTASTNRCGTAGDRLTVAAAPDIAPVVSRLAAAYRPTGSACPVRVVATAPAAVLAGLGRSGAERPDVWIPDSSLWIRQGAAAAEAVVPAAGKPVATSPLVIAFPRPMAQAIVRVSPELRWSDVITLVGNTRGWAGLGHADWGPVRLGRTDAARSTDQVQGLLALAAAAARNARADALRPSAVDTAAVRAAFGTLTKATSRSAADTTALLAGLRAAGGGTSGLSYVSVLPATEQEVLAYNRTSPPIQLTAFYGADGSPADDYPYVVLRPGRAGERVRNGAAAFETYLHGDEARNALTAAGFRTGSRPQPSPTRLANTPAATVDLLRAAWKP